MIIYIMVVYFCHSQRFHLLNKEGNGILLIKKLRRCLVCLVSNQSGQKILLYTVCRGTMDLDMEVGLLIHQTHERNY